MKRKTLLEEFGTLESAVDYIDSCVCENFDLNGDSTLLFPSMQELIQTYLDDVSYTPEQLEELCGLCAEYGTINTAVEAYTVRL